MPARDFVDLQAKPGPDHAALEIHGEKAVIAANQDPGRDIRPAVDLAGLPEGRAGWGALLAGAGGDDVGGNVVQEVHAVIKIAGAPVQPVIEFPGLGLAGGLPPVARASHPEEGPSD